MPQVFKIGSYWVYFWANEGEPREPVHVHISQGSIHFMERLNIIANKKYMQVVKYYHLPMLCRTILQIKANAWKENSVS